nr:MAG TPA: hypothetical protein [Caudoviricetes sp.]
MLLWLLVTKCTLPRHIRRRGYVKYRRIEAG